MSDLIGDEAIVATNDDAALCKLQAIKKGYYKDPYIEDFLPIRLKMSASRKAPEISRGYYARSASIAYVVEQFIAANEDPQIINLGAGYDTLYWRLKNMDRCQSSETTGGDPGKDNTTPPRFNYVEIDMNIVTMHKIRAIRTHANLSRCLPSLEYKGDGVHSDQYHMISFDLRQVEKTNLGEMLTSDCRFDLRKPTLCIAECVLVYMTTQDSNSLLKWLCEKFDNLSIINYEQCNMDDRFGDIMLANMNARHCDLTGVQACKSIESQVERLISNGLPHTRAWTLLDIYKNVILRAEIERIELIEFLDEKELLDQLLEHYCLVVGSNQKIDWLEDEVYWRPKSV